MINDQGTTLYGLAFNGAFTPGTSKRSEWQLLSSKDTPEPGKYNPNFYDKPNLPNWKFKKGQRIGLEDLKPVPPVGTYDVRSKDFEKKLPEEINSLKWFDQKPLEPRKLAVGPGTYTPAILGRNTPLFSFGYREETIWSRDGPAPNLYQNNVDEDKMYSTMQSWKSRKAGFGTAKQRNFIPKSLDIGPGQYNPNMNDKLDGPKFSFTKGSKIIKAVQNFPGPGQYAPKLQHSKSQGYSIGNKYIPFRTSDFFTPGPGTYEPKEVESTANIRIGRDNRTDIVEREQKEKPGPGVYDQVLPPAQVSHLENQSFPRSLRPPIANTNQVPSPGKYDEQLEQKKYEGPKYTMRSKKDKTKINQNPAPGYYEPEDVADKPIIHYTLPNTATPGLGRSNRSNPVISKFNSVGPGSYNISGNLGGNKFSIGKGLRYRDKELEDISPASYKLPDTIGKIPKYLLDKNNDSKFLKLQAAEEKLRMSTAKLH